MVYKDIMKQSPWIPKIVLADKTNATLLARKKLPPIKSGETTKFNIKIIITG